MLFQLATETAAANKSSASSSSSSSVVTLVAKTSTAGRRASTSSSSTMSSTRAPCGRNLSPLCLVALGLLWFVSLQLHLTEAKVQITELKVPQYVENGTADSVVLDCIYTYDPVEDRQMVVKWFFNEDPEPIYQWIFELNTRHVPQNHEGRVNVNYVANATDPWQKYRALNLIRPTVEYTGRYSCHVISMFSQTYQEAVMVVYAKTKSVDLSTRRVTKERSTALQQTGSGGHGHGHGQQQHQQQHHHQRQETPVNNNNNNNYPHGRYHQRTRKPPPAPGAAASLSAADYSPLGPSSASSATGSGSAGGRHLSSAATTEIQCAVHNVFPLPELTIYQVLSDGLRPRSLENARLAQNITKLSNGAYDVSVTAYIEDIELLQQQQQQPKQQQHHQPQPQQQQPKLPMKPTPTIFECLVSQDELRHEIRERTRYTITFDDADFDSGSPSTLSAGCWNLLLLLLAFSLAFV